MGNKNSNTKKNQPNNSDSPSRLAHYQNAKPEFMIENTTIPSQNQSANCSLFNNFPCFQAERQRIETNWKHVFLHRCVELENTNVWAKKSRKLFKKWHQTVPDDFFLGVLEEVEHPSSISEKKQMEVLENSQNIHGSINHYQEKSNLVETTAKTMRKSNEDYHKKMKKMLSNTEILDENFHSNDLNPDFSKENPNKENVQFISELKFSQKNLENVKQRRYSLEQAEKFSNSNSRGSFLRGRGSFDNGKESFIFKNNTFVIDYQTFLSNMSNAGELKNLKSEEEKYHYIRHYKEVTSIIETHLKDQYNPLGFLLLSFNRDFEKENENKMILFEKRFSTEDKYSGIFEEAYGSIRDMIRILQEAVFLYYDLKKFKEQSKDSIFLFTKDNILNLLTSIVFENDYIYEYLLTLQKNIDIFRDNAINKSLQRMKNFKLCEFGICEKMSLNWDTINYFKSSKESPLERLSKSNFKENNKNEFGVVFGQPYKKAILKLKQIETVRSPLHKLKLILKCAEWILKCIRRFYQENGQNFTDNISGDEILTIFIYIICKADVPFLLSHCNIIEKFITNQLSFSISGYYFSTIMAALSFIENKPWKKMTDKIEI